MSKDRDDPYLRKLRKEAKDLARGAGVGHTQGLNMVAAKLGHANWHSFVEKYTKAKETPK